MAAAHGNGDDNDVVVVVVVSGGNDDGNDDDGGTHTLLRAQPYTHAQHSQQTKSELTKHSTKNQSS